MVHMRQIFIIMALVIAGFFGVNASLDGLPGWEPQSGTCQGQACSVGIVRTTCCGEAIEESYCPMSEGPCQCSSVPDRSPKRLPDAPLPRSDRDSLTAVPQTQGAVVVWLPSAPRVSARLRRSTVACGDLTHNEIQAQLGIWHT